MKYTGDRVTSGWQYKWNNQTRDVTGSRMPRDENDRSGRDCMKAGDPFMRTWHRRDSAIPRKTGVKNKYEENFVTGFKN